MGWEGYDWMSVVSNGRKWVRRLKGGVEERVGMDGKGNKEDRNWDGDGVYRFY